MRAEADHIQPPAAGDRSSTSYGVAILLSGTIRDAEGRHFNSLERRYYVSIFRLQYSLDLR